MGEGARSTALSRVPRAGRLVSRSDQDVNSPGLLHAVEGETALCGAELSEVRDEPWDPNTPRACPSCIARTPAGPE